MFGAVPTGGEMDKLRNLNYRCVVLTKSHFEEQRSKLIETYLSIEDGEYLHYFRERAGLYDFYNGLAGWYGNDASTFGQILGGFVRLYLVTGDERLRRKAVALADGWGECADVSEKVVEVGSLYTFDKMITGFLDMYEYLHYDRAIEYVRRLTVSAMERFDTNIDRDGLQIMPGSLIEWYTMPEQLLRAYILTGEKIYYDYAFEWDYTYYWDKINAGDFASIGPRHAYSHVNALSSAVMEYVVTDDEYYLNAAKNGYSEILKNHTFATGGYGPAECLFANEKGFLGYTLKSSWDKKDYDTYTTFFNAQRGRDNNWGSCEVSCCSWAVFKLCNYLMCITGEAKYGDWAEKLLYNGVGGQPPITRDGQVMYYADYFIDGGMKTVVDGRLQENGSSFEWQCCTGTFPEDVAEYSNMLYYRNDSSIYVSQYLPSRLTVTVNSVTVSLENKSMYPKEKELKFVLHTPEKLETTINFRVPSWATGENVVCVNGIKQNVPIVPNEWISLEKIWEDGDEISIEFEFVLRFEKVDEYSSNIAALVYGPVVMVCNKMTLFDADMDNPGSWLNMIQKDGYSYAFETRPGCIKPYKHLKREFYPYYEVPEYQHYYMYNRFA